MLSETPAGGQRRRLTAPARPPAPGYGPPLQLTLYAPLEFTVGTERDLTHSSGTWSGDLMASVRLGSVFSAARVRSAFRVGAGGCAAPGPCGGRWKGIRVVASTADPSGRKLIVTIAPTVDGALRVRVRPSPAAGIAGIDDTFGSGPGEAFHGFGGRHLGLDQRGASFYNWTAEENVNATDFHIPGAAGGTLLYPNGPQAAYYPQASFVSSRGYGFLLGIPSWLASASTTAVKRGRRTPPREPSITPWCPARRARSRR